MTDVTSTVKSVERAVASSDHNFSDVYANIVQLQQSSGDMRQFQQAMDAANKEIARRGLNDLNHDGKPDFVLVGAADGMIITGDPTRGMLQARDQHFQVFAQTATNRRKMAARRLLMAHNHLAMHIHKMAHNRIPTTVKRTSTLLRRPTSQMTLPMRV